MLNKYSQQGTPVRVGPSLRWPMRTVTTACALLALAVSAQAGMDSGGNARKAGGGHDESQAARSVESARSEHSRGGWQGRPLAHWVESFGLWFTSLPLNVNPAIDATGIHCGTLQKGPVWFLTGPAKKDTDPDPFVFSRSCSVPQGKAILFSAASYLNDYPCPDPTFGPAAGQSLDDFLGAGAAAFIETYSLVEATLDGKPLKVRRVTTRGFGFAAAVDLQQLDSCITGSSQVGLIDGHFVAIDPLPPGDHVLRLRTINAIPQIGETDGTFVLSVR